MNVEDLLSNLSGVSVHKNLNQEYFAVKNITDIQSNNLYLIKGRKYFDIFLEKVNSLENVGVFLCQKFASKEILDELDKLNLSFIATVDNFELLLCEISQYEYDRKTSEINFTVDGRTMGSTSIDPSSDVSTSSFIGDYVSIGENVTVHPGATIMPYSSIGSGSVIFPNVTVYPFVSIGENCILHGGSSIGADGFGFHFHNGVHHKIWHSGGVVIGNQVEVGANSCIDGGTFSPTIIGEGSKFDNHVQIGHNCTLGMGVILCGHVAIGGSTEIGNFCVFGGKSGMGDNMKLGDASQVAGAAMVNTDWPAKSVLGGHPARPIKEWMRGLAYVRKESLKK